MPHVEADYHLPSQPGTNVAVLTALDHVIVTEGLVNQAFVRERCDPAEFQDWAEFVADKRHSPEASAGSSAKYRIRIALGELAKGLKVVQSVGVGWNAGS